MIKRNVLIDIVRSFSMLWIVCVWHLLSYSEIYSFTDSWLSKIITDIALGSFMLISGYLLAKKYKAGDLKLFYKNRLLRILPLFFSAVMLFPNSTSLGVRMLNLLGISPIMGGQMHTMWFVAILMEFYLLFPLMVLYGKRRYQIAVILIVFIAYNVIGTFLPIDERIIWLYPCFAIGCLLGVMQLNIGSKLQLSEPLLKIINYLSTASFCAYLFHRHIMAVMEKTIMPEDGIGRLIFLYVVCVPIILIFGYYVQALYNRVLKSIFINDETRS